MPRCTMWARLIHLALTVPGTAHTGTEVPDPVATIVSRTLHTARYKRADADLDGDGRSEALVYVTDPSYCGSGGCTLLVLSPGERGYRMALRSTVTQLPVRLLPTFTRGWRDLGVTVSGGGITRPYVARLRFDGHSYPGNPTAAPRMSSNQPLGRVLIDR